MRELFTLKSERGDRENLTGSHKLFMNATEARLENAEGDESPGVMRMKCVPYNSEGPHWAGGVKFRAGCFTESLANIASGEEKAYIFADAHMGNPTEILANSQAKGLRATVSFEDKKDALYATVVLPNTNAGRDVAELVKNGAIDSASVGVMIASYKVDLDEDDDEREIMTITNAILEETSLVAFPRFKDTDVEMESEAPKKSLRIEARDERLEALEAQLEQITEQLEQITQIDSTEAAGSADKSGDDPSPIVDIQTGDNIIELSSWRELASKPVPSRRQLINILDNNAKEVINYG